MPWEKGRQREGMRGAWYGLTKGLDRSDILLIGTANNGRGDGWALLEIIAWPPGEKEIRKEG